MKYYDLVEESATYEHSGGTFTMTGALPGRIGLTSAGYFFDPNEPLYYYASNADKSQWEQGRGVWDGSAVFTRQSVALSSSSGSAVNFSGPVTVALVHPSRSLLVVDSSSGSKPVARGVDAMAAGVEAQAYGDASISIGYGASIGSDEFPINNAMAIGVNAQSFVEGACAIGRNASGRINNAVAGVRHFHWSGSASSFGAETVNLAVDSVLPNLPEFTTMAFEAIVLGQSSTGGQKAYAAKVSGLLNRPGSGAPALEGSITVTEIAKTSGVTAAASFGVVGTGGDFAVRGVGVASQQWYWTCSIHGVLSS